MFQKITYGYVVQTFDENGVFQGQEFIAGDQVEYIDPENGEELAFSTPQVLEAYEPFDMIQPKGY